MNKKLWIGLVGLKSFQDNPILNEGETAYTNLILLAKDAQDYKRRTAIHFKKYNIEVLEIEDIDLLEERQKDYQVDEALLDLSKLVLEDGIPRFGTLHLYDDECE